MDGKPDEGRMWRYLYILIKWRKFLILNFIIITVIGIIIALIYPRWYKATASVVPPKKMDIMSELGSFMREFIPIIGGIGAGQDPTMTYLAILNSRTAMEKVIHKFNLFQVYEISDSSMEDAVKTLRGNTEFIVDENGVLHISVYDRDPVRAAQMANYFVDVLNEINIKLNMEEARNNRIIIEKRYRQNLADLKAAEDTLKKFQEKYGIYYLPEQTKAAISAAAELEAQIKLEEVKLGVLKRQLGEDAPEVKLAELKIDELKKKLMEMKIGEEELKNEQSGLFVPFKDIPELGIAYLRLYRNYEIQNKLLEFIYPLYEQAKLEEQKNVPTILVLDKAVPPERKAKPRRLLIMLIVYLIGFSIVTLFISAKELWERNAEPIKVAISKATASEPGR
jgi:capsule polysaccharide export protein KpsE/RkpR